METKFIKIPKTEWSQFPIAGDAWLESLRILIDNKKQISWGVFYVIPQIVAFCLELFVKAIAAHEDVSFDAKTYRHKTNEILINYASRISLFKKLLNDKTLMNLIKEYQKTIDTRFGGTYVSIDGDDQQKIIDTVYELRREMYRRTKVSYLR